MVLHGRVLPLGHSEPTWAKTDSRKKEQGLGHQAPKAGRLQKQRCWFCRAVGKPRWKPGGRRAVVEGPVPRFLLGLLKHSCPRAEQVPFGQTLP